MPISGDWRISSPSPAGVDDVRHEGREPLRGGGAEDRDVLGREVAGADDARPQGVLDVVVHVGHAVQQAHDLALEGGRPAAGRCG